MRLLALVVCCLCAHLPAEDKVPMETAIVAAGCFWGVEDVLSKTPGVADAVSGYIGGTVAKPSYRQVCSGSTGHAEAVRITYDPAVISYCEILDVFWNLHDPTQVNRQGPDHGTQYRSAIFPLNAAQRAIAEASKEVAQAYFSKPIATTIEAEAVFWPAEDYHQDYFAVNGGTCHSKRQGLQVVTAQKLLSDEQWKTRLAPEVFHVLRQAGTERPFGPGYAAWKDVKHGLAACAGCGLELFNCDTQFDSGCGWPSFDAALSGRVTRHTDTSAGMQRTEIRCYRCQGHLGHVFDDGPGPSGERFCVNGAALQPKKP